MPVITYTASRSLRAGVSSGDVEQIETDLQQADPSTRTKAFRVEALDNSRGSYLYALGKVWQINSDLQSWASDLEQWHEFLDSVANAERFDIDFTGTIASPGTDVPVELLSTSWQITRQGNLYFTAAFQVRELSS